MKNAPTPTCRLHALLESQGENGTRCQTRKRLGSGCSKDCEQDQTTITPHDLPAPLQARDFCRPVFRNAAIHSQPKPPMTDPRRWQTDFDRKTPTSRARHHHRRHHKLLKLSSGNTALLGRSGRIQKAQKNPWLSNGRVQPRREAQRSGVGWNAVLARTWL